MPDIKHTENYTLRNIIYLYIFHQVCISDISSINIVTLSTELHEQSPKLYFVEPMLAHICRKRIRY